jgi:hypothetical protein
MRQQPIHANPVKQFLRATRHTSRRVRMTLVADHAIDNEKYPTVTQRKNFVMILPLRSSVAHAHVSMLRVAGVCYPDKRDSEHFQIIDRLVSQN